MRKRGFEQNNTPYDQDTVPFASPRLRIAAMAGDVNARIRDISSRAHAGKLRLDELQGGTFTVNNTGWFGSVVSMPIINAP